MAEYRLKIKIGEHEFDAEGAADVVQAQFETFKELVSQLPVQVAKPTAPTQEPKDQPNGNQLNLDKIMRAQDRLITLTMHVDRIPDAILLILLGQRIYRNNDSVTGGEILDGLRESGRPLERADRILQALSGEGLIITVGQHRSRRYRLTNLGVTRAEQIARELISLVP